MFPRQPRNGFILLHALLLLLIGSSLVAVILGVGLGRSRDSHAETTVLRLESAAESGVHHILSQFLGRETSRNMDMVSVRHLTIDGVDVELTTQFSDGLLGLRSAEKRYIQDVLASVLGMEASLASNALTKIGAISSYAELVALDGIGPDGLNCLLPYVTLFSERKVPVPSHAPAKLKSLLGLKEGLASSVMQDEAISTVASVIRIQARGNLGGYRSRRLLVEAQLTGRSDQPVAILEWLWLPAEG